MTDEAKWGTDMNLHDNVKGFIRGGVQHLVECESGIVDNVVDLSPFPVTRRLSWFHSCNYELPTEQSRPRLSSGSHPHQHHLRQTGPLHQQPLFQPPRSPDA